MDEADALTVGSKRSLEVEDDSKRASGGANQSATDAAFPTEDGQKSATIMRNSTTQNSSGKMPGDRSKSAAAPQAETLMSYELVRHQVQRRLHVEKISTDAIHALVPDVEFRLFQLLQVCYNSHEQSLNSLINTSYRKRTASGAAADGASSFLRISTAHAGC